MPGSVLDARDAAMNKADKRNPYPSGAYLLLGETINAIGKRKSKGEEVEVRLNAGPLSVAFILSERSSHCYVLSREMTPCNLHYNKIVLAAMLRTE